MACMPRIVLLGFLTTTLIACQSRSLYSWGSYESSIHRFYNSEGGFQIERDIERLSHEISRTPAEKIPPGKAAHLGYLYALQGDHAVAENYFKMERSLFPESQVFIDRVIDMNRASAERRDG